MQSTSKSWVLTPKSRLSFSRSACAPLLPPLNHKIGEKTPTMTGITQDRTLRSVITSLRFWRSWTNLIWRSRFRTLHTFPVETFLQPLTNSSIKWTRLKLRKARISTGQAGTLITYSPSFKDEIHSLLNTIRKIINANVSEVNKRDKIFRKIALLQDEIDRDRTTIDAVFSRMVVLSRVVGECAHHLEPLVQKLERITAALRDGAERVPLLLAKERPKLLSDAYQKPKNELEDEIPF